MSDFYRGEYLAALGAGIANQAQALANTVRNQHSPDCGCHEDNAITQPIPQGEQE